MVRKKAKCKVPYQVKIGYWTGTYYDQVVDYYLVLARYKRRDPGYQVWYRFGAN